MKLCTLALVLAIFTGSLASIRGEKRHLLFTQLLEDVEDYLIVVASATIKEVNWLESLNSSQKLCQQIVKDYRKVGEYVDRLLRKSPTEVEEMALLVRDVTRKLLAAVIVELGHINRMLRGTLAPFAEPILEKMRGQAEALSASIQEFTIKEEERLKLQADELMTHEAELDSFIQEVHSQWLKFWKSLAPWADWFQDYYTQGMETLKPYLASVLRAPGGHPKE